MKFVRTGFGTHRREPPFLNFAITFCVGLAGIVAIVFRSAARSLWSEVRFRRVGVRVGPTCSWHLDNRHDFYSRLGQGRNTADNMLRRMLGGIN
jgi:hypothetical protein